MDTSLKGLLLAGIGSMALTYEKANEMVDTLVKKGELTVNQGKELNEELKRVVESQKTGQKSQNVDAETLKSVLQELNLPTKADIDELKTRIDNLEKNN
ncbi:phasin family protein [Sporanaerobacter acetigenes]|uniref:Poly(Hydroxyalkanoate) granule-associated protein n=1 Tax=Sporanaerobacter acetigenes DSM 13106 TaxID=1123281 RepID=A0A1M5VT44_9FIRM|nr:phasin family protein [Sporanaerobacter acetigenes]SHH78358.1 poly(hydroxyalkanoate) granule-associated protein [Sporanaerobacter acetigenes DSM 13106]